MLMPGNEGAVLSRPRVLFLTPAAFNRVTGGGITFGNLFAGWPKDRIATAHNDPVPTDDVVCDNYFRLGNAELRKLGASFRPSSLATSAASSRVDGGLLRLARVGKEVVFGNMLPDTGRLSPRFERWITEFDPQVLYTILGSNSMIDLAHAVLDRFRIPMVVHMMDDWPAISYRGGLLSHFPRKKMERLLRSLMHAATYRLGICDAMCDAYQDRYGVPFVPFQNALDTTRWTALGKSDLTVSPQANVLYIGSVLPFAQLQSLVDCCNAVEQLARSGERVRLSIYSPSFYAEKYRERLVVGPSVSLFDSIANDNEFFAKLRDADVLLLPVNFDSQTIKYIRYSMPTKVPAYLLSGTPILAYGPPEVAQMRYARDEGWAHLVDHPGVDRVAAGIGTLISDAALRRRISENARRLAVERHDAGIVRARFQALLTDAVLQSRGIAMV